MRTQVSRLQDARRIAAKGPDWGPLDVVYQKLSKEEFEEYQRRYRIWAESWVLPAIDEQIDRLRKRNKT